ncbi:MAG: hypothetical protein HYY55_03615 [Candidatus Niyogibacteria bacterium]|nr:MAG: hypothetical protein HYY55_03615 [Candidatus Niyogibacteria bacterium]
MKIKNILLFLYIISPLALAFIDAAMDSVDFGQTFHIFYGIIYAAVLAYNLGKEHGENRQKFL